MIERNTIPCRICGWPTPMRGTRRCNGCWEIEHRLRDRQHADKVLEHASQEYKIKVLPAEAGSPGVYTVLAASAIDARVIAFIQDGGMNLSCPVDADLRELAKMYTEIVK